MPRRKKKFIDKKNAITYHLIHRSQKDPLQADENASQMVLVTGDELAQAKRRERLTTYGIYYDDDYDYEQHLRDVDEINKVEPDRDIELFRIGSTAQSKVKLPNEVLPSQTEEKIGMLELAAPISGPRLDWDPDIVAALDGNNDEPMEELEDDFIALANESGDEDENVISDGLHDWQKKWIEEHMSSGQSGPTPDNVHIHVGGNVDGDDEGEEISSDFDDEEGDELNSLQSFSDDDAKTRFTNYSMSSSVIKRNEGLTLIDDKFEQLYAEYDEDEIGALDHEEIDGKVSTAGPMMEFLLQQFEKQQVKDLPEALNQKDDIEICSDVGSSDDEEEFTKVVVDEGHTNQWDCESILSTYSNLYNHPKVLEEPWTKKKSKKIQLTKKLGIPVECLPQKGLTRKQIQALDKLNDGDIKITPVRHKDETAEEKRQRKAAVKEERKERRLEKKNTKLAFRHEEAAQKRQQISSANNLAGQKIL